MTIDARQKAIELLGEKLYQEKFGDTGFTIYVVDQRCGRVRYSARTCTIPRWCIKNPETGNAIHKLGYKGELLSSFWIYYLAHELAHVISKSGSHGSEFMKTFIEICPAELQFFEIGYKPRNAKAAGIKNTTKLEIK